MLTDLQNTRTV